MATVFVMTTDAGMDYEANIADNLRRILGERPNMNPNKIAVAMSGRNVPMDAKAVSRILSHERRIKLNEAMCLAAVLDVRTEDLVTPPEVAADKQVQKLLGEYLDADRAVGEAREVAHAALEKLATYIKNMEGDDIARRRIAEWVDSIDGVSDSALLTDYWMGILTEDEKYRSSVNKVLAGDLRRSLHALRSIDG